MHAAESTKVLLKHRPTHLRRVPAAEGRLLAVRNAVPSHLARTPSRNQRRSSGLHGVRETARQSRDLKFTALLHHVNIELLTSSFYQLKKNAAVGVDQSVAESSLPREVYRGALCG